MEKAFQILLPLGLISFFVPSMDNLLVFAEFDSAGNYVCNPFERSLETNIYTDTVSRINYKMELYSKTNPLATPQEQHDAMLQDQKTWDLYYKSKACISSIGINPDDIATLDPAVQQAVAVPEFSLMSYVVITISITGSMIIYRIFQRTKL